MLPSLCYHFLTQKTMKPQSLWVTGIWQMQNSQTTTKKETFMLIKHLAVYRCTYQTFSSLILLTDFDKISHASHWTRQFNLSGWKWILHLKNLLQFVKHLTWNWATWVCVQQGRTGTLRLSCTLSVPEKCRLQKVKCPSNSSHYSNLQTFYVKTSSLTSNNALHFPSNFITKSQVKNPIKRPMETFMSLLSPWQSQHPPSSELGRHWFHLLWQPPPHGWSWSWSRWFPSPMCTCLVERSEPALSVWATPHQSSPGLPGGGNSNDNHYNNSNHHHALTLSTQWYVTAYQATILVQHDGTL